jgi:hypothetical protein
LPWAKSSVSWILKNQPRSMMPSGRIVRTLRLQSVVKPSDRLVSVHQPEGTIPPFAALTTQNEAGHSSKGAATSTAPLPGSEQANPASQSFSKTAMVRTCVVATSELST